MRIFDLSEDLPADARGAVLAIGNFDGVHLGHRGVIKETGAIAKRLGAPLAVMTFEPAASVCARCRAISSCFA
jgi:riboflavin kinase/FMN adenylyltransferase